MEVGQHLPIDGPCMLEDMEAVGGPRRVIPAQVVEGMKTRLRTHGSIEDAAHFIIMQEMNDPQHRG